MTTLAAVAVFSPPSRQNLVTAFGGQFTELSRFCIHPLYHKKNFASWFLARSLSFVTGLVVAYADSTIGHHGTIYKATNFTEHHQVDPDYWYEDTTGHVMNKRRLYGKARKMSMTEAEYATTYGYVRRFGGSKTCYVIEV